MKFKHIEVITVGKVGSANFLPNSSNSKSKRVHHGHSLLRLKRVLKTQSNTLIIVGIRDPIERNMSHFFQCYNDNFFNDIRTRVNDYKSKSK